jgi:hypothetical protein
VSRLVTHPVPWRALAVALFAASAVWATWPAIRHLDGGRYLARPAPGAGEAAAGDHLQLGWAFWLPGHQLERGSLPWRDPYSFQPLADAAWNTQGWLFGLPFWGLDALAGPVWAYNVLLLATVVLAGGLATWWLRAVGVSQEAALIGGVAFALAPYRIGQSTGHLLGMISFLLPAMLLALERRRVLVASLCLIAIPLSGQTHLALAAIPLFAGYAWARLPRHLWVHTALGVGAAVGAGVFVHRTVVAGSIAAGRQSFSQVERYSAELSDFVTRSVGAGVEELVFLGWSLPLLALAGLACAWRAGRGLAVTLGVAAVLPCVLALGANLPLYEQLWEAFPPLRLTRVPERLMPVACLALAGLAALAVDRALPLRQRLGKQRALAAGLAALLTIGLALDLRVPLFAAVDADEPNAAYASLPGLGPGGLLELPVIRPDIHFGSVYLAYARQAPRERLLGYSTTAPPQADRVARSLRGVSCGRGRPPRELGVRFVAVHRGVYEQSGFFAPVCADAAEQSLRRRGWRRLVADGRISLWVAR